MSRIRPERLCVKRCGRRTSAEGHICTTCRGPQPKAGTCKSADCDTPTKSKTGLCHPCRREIKKAAAAANALAKELAALEFDEDGDPCGLSGGQWVPRGGILRWEAAA